MVTAAMPAAERPLLTVADVRKTYRKRGRLFAPGAENRAIDGVSLSIRAGEILGLVGESGCGKSTFAKVLLGLEEADAGTMEFDGKPIFGPGVQAVPSNRRGIQMVFQDPFGSLNPRKPVLEIIGEGLRIRGDRSRRAIGEEVARHLALVGLSGDAMGKYPHQFSGGQRQRICIARAIIMQPKLLIADEAVSALDVSVQMQILNLLLDLREQLGLTIMFISHDMGVIEYLCDRVCVMYQGNIVEQGPTADVIDAAQHPYTMRLIAARPRIADTPRRSFDHGQATTSAG
jgi:ABC-type glutathione transport system ATPase component